MSVDDTTLGGGVPFYAQTAVLDSYIHSADPTADQIALKVVLDTLRAHADLRSYFFRSGPHPAWAEVLWDGSFLRTPPAPQQTDNGMLRPRWEEQEYLISVASHAPDVVLKHITALKGEPEYGSRAIHALHAIPVTFVETALPQLLDWLRDPHSSKVTAGATYVLSVKLAGRGHTALAFDLLRAVLMPQPSPDKRQAGELIFNTAAVALFDLDSYDYSLDEDDKFPNALKLFRSLDTRQLVSILEDHLLNALRTEAEALNSSEFDRTSWWRTAIEDTSQDIGDEYKDNLLVALRDTVEAWVEQDAAGAEPLVNRYLRDKHEILRRLGLHVIGRFPLAYRSHVARELLSDENLHDVGIHHEYFELLRRGYPHLDKGERQSLLTVIGQGPRRETLERLADWAEENHGEEREDYIRGYTRAWVKNRLWMLREHLSGDSARFLDEAVKETGEPEHPEYTSWSSGAYMVTDVSPITHEQLYRMPPEVLIDFLRRWQPELPRTFGHEQVTRGALAQTVAEVAFSDSDKYGSYLRTIAFIAPTFAAALLGAFTSVKRAEPVRWTEALELCEALLADEIVRLSVERNADGDWRGVRQAMVSLLEASVDEPKADAGGQKRDIRAPTELLPRVRDLLLVLLDDPDPEPEDDRPPEGWFGHQDPATVALNRVRPRAMLALIQYAAHRALIEQGEDNDDKAEAYVVRLEPEVREALTRKLNPEAEPSAAVRAVYGWNLYRLRWLDRGWLEAHLDAIFPEGDDPETAWLFVAAWDAYVAFNRNTFARAFFDKLRPKYERAINNLARGLVTRTHLEPSRGLASHLLWEYLTADYDIRSAEGRESLLLHFFERAPGDQRGGAVWWLWRICESNPQRLKESWARVRALWEWRADEAARANHPTDFDKEMEWYARLPLVAFELETIMSLWALLEGTLPHVARSGNQYMGWHSLEEYLAKEVHRDPARAIQFYHLMYKQSSRQTWHYMGDESRTIIEVAAADEASRQEALSLIDTLARMGNHQHRDIYQQYTG